MCVRSPCLPPMFCLKGKPSLSIFDPLQRKLTAAKASITITLTFIFYSILKYYEQSRFSSKASPASDVSLLEVEVHSVGFWKKVFKNCLCRELAVASCISYFLAAELLSNCWLSPSGCIWAYYTRWLLKTGCVSNSVEK